MKKLYMTLAGALLAVPAMFAQDAIYLVGNMMEGGDWNINSDEFTLPKVSDGVYEATFEFPEHLGDWWFTFYKEIGAWNNAVRISPAENDQTLDFVDGVFVSTGCVSNTENSWMLKNWAGGEMTINVDTNDMIVTFTTAADYEPLPSPEPEEGVIYLIGNPNDWNINSNAYSLKSVGGEVYEGTFEIEAGTGIFFRFYTELGNWAQDGQLPSVGPLPNDNTNVAVEFTDGLFSGTCEPGKGSWQLETWEGGWIQMIVDLENWTVEFSVVEDPNAGVGSLLNANEAPVYYNLQGVRVNNPEKGIYIVNGKKVILK